MNKEGEFADDNRTVGLAGAIAIGVGGMVGGGIFAVLGEAVSLAHGATVIAFLFAGFVALLTSYSYARLSVSYQSRGGTVTFIDKAFNHNLLSGTVNVMLWLSYLITISLYAVAFASYAQTFFPDHESVWLKHSFTSLAILLPAIINLLSASVVSKSEFLIVFIKVALLVFIIAVSLPYVNTERFSPAHWESFFSIIVAGMIIFVSYEGFELIANAAEEVKKPESTLPKAFYGSVLLVIVLYALIALVVVGTVPESILLQAKDYALAVAAKPALGQAGFTVVSISALLATLSAINATIYGNSRLGYILAAEGALPETLAREKNNVPVMGVIIATILSLILANSIDLTAIAIIGSAGFLLIFFIVNIAAYKLRKKIKANGMIVATACLVSGMALLTLIFHTFSSNQKAIAIFFSFMVISFLFEFTYGQFVRKHIFNRPYKQSGNILKN